MKVYYDSDNKRLVYIGQRATPSWWDTRWSAENSKTSIDDRKNNRFILSTLSKYIPDKKGRILEGGCGSGQVLFCMYSHGYKATGVDFAERTILKIKESNPELDVRIGDVRNLQFSDDHFTAYWSWGVIEHFWEGYRDILHEMQRVLINGGYLFLAFPYMSPLRRLKARIGLYMEFQVEQKESFYQFALDSKTVIKDCQELGFTLLDKIPVDGLIGFKNEVSSFRPLLEELYDYKGKSLTVRGLRYFFNQVLSSFAAHQMFLVFRKAEK
ncbi:MAG: class I SAM-dependent methyltransferase [Candidatus Bathyarchaeota archaeon]|nr:class I SAM-dependent methyltransferase [Candidatus Bathyarchaeota archaeon]